MTDKRLRPASTSQPVEQAGFSLVEGLIAAALLLVVALSVLPLFTRALQSNLSGGRSSQLSTFVSADIEAVNQSTIDRQDWQVEGSAGGVLNIPRQYWDIGPASDGEVPEHLGDEGWVANEGDATGLVLWWRDESIRKYSLADLQILASSDPSAPAVAVVGHPMLLDSPLETDENGHLTEVRVTIKENRAEMPAAAGQRMTVGHFRAF